MTDSANRDAWEQRSQRWGASLRSVLFKGLPERLNEHIHRWHIRLILDELRDRPRARVLDVGCGYGRVTTELLRHYPELDIAGVDLTANYVRLYHEQTGCPAVVASVEELPADLGTDCVLCVTVLMYVESANLDRALRNLLERLSDGGTLILIEPHTSCVKWQTAFGLLTLLRGKKASGETGTGGRHFGTAELNGLIRDAGGAIVRERRMPLTTILMLPLFACCTVLPSSRSGALLRCVAWADRALERLPLPTLYRALTIRRIQTA